MVKAVMKEIDDSFAKLWNTKPAEIDNIFKRNVKNGKHFSVWVGAYQEIEVVCRNAYNFVAWGQQEKGDLDTLKMIASESIKANAGSFRVSFGMGEFADLLQKVGDAYLECKDYAELVELSKKIHLYGSRMFYWLDSMIPWAKISENFNAIMNL